MKTCTKCGDIKSTTEFSKHASRRDGLQCHCKVCNSLALSAWRTANPEKKREDNAEYRASNQENIRSYKVEYRAANPDKVKAYADAWHAANPEARRIREQNRRARKLANGGRLSPGLAAKLFNLQRGKCACCHVSIDDGNHLDHRIPVALGGPNEDWNMQLLCGPCNLSKGAKHPVDFMQQRGFLI